MVSFWMDYEISRNTVQGLITVVPIPVKFSIQSFISTIEFNGQNLSLDCIVRKKSAIKLVFFINNIFYEIHIFLRTYI